MHPMNDTTDANDTTTDERPPADGDAHGHQPRLLRHSRKAVLGGVCAGLGRYLRVDPLFIRIAFIVLAFTGGFGILAYFIAWLVIPSDDGRDPGEEMRRAASSAPTWLQVIGVVVVAMVVAGQFHGVPSGLAWAAVLIGAGIVLYRDSERAESRPHADGVPASTVPPPPPGPHQAPGPHHAVGSPPAGAPPGAPYTAQAARPPSPPSPPRPPSILGRLTVAVILLWCGAAALLDQAGVIAWAPRHYVAAATVITGVGLLVGAWWGRGRALIFLGLALLPVLLLAGFPASSVRGGLGERDYRPASTVELDPGYELFAGEMTLDLSGIDLDGEDVDLTVRIGLGELTVIAPPEATLDVEGRVVAGQANVLGRSSEGVGFTTSRHHPGAEGAGSLTLHVYLGAGEFTVRHPR